MGCWLIVSTNVGLCTEEKISYGPYAKVLVKSETTPKDTIFDLLCLNHHNNPTIENRVADTHIRASWGLYILKINCTAGRKDIQISDMRTVAN